MKQAERQIQADILAALGTRPDVRCFRLNVGFARTAAGAGVRFGVPGMADILACVGPRYVWLEVKTPRGRQTPEQRNFQAAIEAIGGVYRVVRSVEDAVAVIQQVESEEVES